jgi:hypothetical protein
LTLELINLSQQKGAGEPARALLPRQPAPDLGKLESISTGTMRMREPHRDLSPDISQIVPAPQRLRLEQSVRVVQPQSRLASRCGDQPAEPHAVLGRILD